MFFIENEIIHAKMYAAKALPTPVTARESRDKYMEALTQDGNKHYMPEPGLFTPFDGWYDFAYTLRSALVIPLFYANHLLVDMINKVENCAMAMISLATLDPWSFDFYASSLTFNSFVNFALTAIDGIILTAWQLMAITTRTTSTVLNIANDLTHAVLDPVRHCFFSRPAAPVEGEVVHAPAWQQNTPGNFGQ